MNKPYKTKQNAHSSTELGTRMGTRIKLNVDGRVFEVNASTLQTDPQSTLSQLADTPEGQEVFIDRDPDYFQIILDYLKNGDAVSLGYDPAYLRELLREAKHFNLAGLETLIKRALEIKAGDTVKWNEYHIEEYSKAYRIALVPTDCFKTENNQGSMIDCTYTCPMCGAILMDGKWLHTKYVRHKGQVQAMMPSLRGRVVQVRDAGCLDVQWPACAMHLPRDTVCLASKLD